MNTSERLIVDDLGFFYTDARFGQYLEVAKEYASPEPWHQLLGNPREIQGDIFIEAQKGANDIYSLALDHPRRSIIEAGFRDWRLLLQIDSDDELKVMWGDVGTVYFCIRNDDLAKQDFSRTWTIMQCH